MPVISLAAKREDELQKVRTEAAETLRLIAKAVESGAIEAFTIICTQESRAIRHYFLGNGEDQAIHCFYLQKVLTEALFQPTGRSTVPLKDLVHEEGEENGPEPANE